MGDVVERNPADLNVIAGNLKREWSEDGLGDQRSWSHTALSGWVDGWLGGWTRVFPPCPTCVGFAVWSAKLMDCLPKHPLRQQKVASGNFEGKICHLCKVKIFASIMQNMLRFQGQNLGLFKEFLGTFSRFKQEFSLSFMLKICLNFM